MLELEESLIHSALWEDGRGKIDHIEEFKKDVIHLPPFFSVKQEQQKGSLKLTPVENFIPW